MLWIAKLLSSVLSSNLLQVFSQAFVEKLKAQNNSEKIAADLQGVQDSLAAQTVIAEESKWFPFVRWGFAFPFMVYDCKILIWDRVLSMGHTDGLSTELWQIQMIIITAYFGHSGVEKLAKAIAKRA